MDGSLALGFLVIFCLAVGSSGRFGNLLIVGGKITSNPSVVLGPDWQMVP